VKNYKNELRQKNDTISTLLDDGSFITDDFEKATQLSEYFAFCTTLNIAEEPALPVSADDKNYRVSPMLDLFLASGQVLLKN